MRISFNRRRHLSLAPLPRHAPRAPRVIVVLGILCTALCTATVAFATVQRGSVVPNRADDPSSIKVPNAVRATHDFVDERVHAHLKRLLDRRYSGLQKD